MDDVGFVSIWLGATGSLDSLRTALLVEEGPDEMLGSPLSRAVGMTGINEWLVEWRYLEDLGGTTELADVLRAFSYADVIVPQVLATGVSFLPGENCLVLFYDYKPVRVVTSILVASVVFRFGGTFWYSL